ncbi:DUF2306 domain-containing protein [Paenibacillus piri]|uniref:DUF2306 domain-containing protein n=1 Tax=Paenibacillus piri TaxID=2547395 RepID=A0A4R5KEC2_9BACL|nr:DUF2306 domain-containing protein [Paenibacillus piri]TDF93015.1 DUF2306 domain-containing protein [Paenibacillus piri]
MSIYSLLLIAHIAAGTICLLSGACAIFVRKQKGLHTVLGETYHIHYIFVFLTAVIMSMMKWSELQYLFYIALFSYAQALYGYLARKLRWSNWLSKHIIGMLGSYIGIITAVLVVNGEPVTALTGIPKLSLWFIPTIIGSPLIFFTTRRFRRPPRKI